MPPSALSTPLGADEVVVPAQRAVWLSAALVSLAQEASPPRRVSPPRLYAGSTFCISCHCRNGREHSVQCSYALRDCLWSQASARHLPRLSPDTAWLNTPMPPAAPPAAWAHSGPAPPARSIGTSIGLFHGLRRYPVAPHNTEPPGALRARPAARRVAHSAADAGRTAASRSEQQRRRLQTAGVGKKRDIRPRRSGGTGGG